MNNEDWDAPISQERMHELVEEVTRDLEKEFLIENFIGRIEELESALLGLRDTFKGMLEMFSEDSKNYKITVNLIDDIKELVERGI